jgi:hypothetical protein
LNTTETFDDENGSNINDCLDPPIELSNADEVIADDDGGKTSQLGDVAKDDINYSLPFVWPVSTLHFRPLSQFVSKAATSRDKFSSWRSKQKNDATLFVSSSDLVDLFETCPGTLSYKTFFCCMRALAK